MDRQSRSVQLWIWSAEPSGEYRHDNVTKEEYVMLDIEQTMLSLSTKEC